MGRARPHRLGLAYLREQSSLLACSQPAWSIFPRPTRETVRPGLCMQSLNRDGMSEQLEVFPTGAVSTANVDACVSVLEEGNALTNVQTAADELPHCLFVVVMRDDAD